jgi:hypothetical protein
MLQLLIYQNLELDIKKIVLTHCTEWKNIFQKEIRSHNSNYISKIQLTCKISKTVVIFVIKNYTHLTMFNIITMKV